MMFRVSGGVEFGKSAKNRRYTAAVRGTRVSVIVCVICRRDRACISGCARQSVSMDKF